MKAEPEEDEDHERISIDSNRKKSKDLEEENLLVLTSENVANELPNVHAWFSIWKRIESIRTSKITIFWVVFVAVFTDSLFYSIVIPILPLYMSSLNISQFWIGVLFSLYSITLLLTTSISVKMVNFFGRKLSMLGGLLILGISTLLFAFGNSIWILFVARGIQGASSMLTWTSGLSLIADSFPASEHGQAYGSIFASVGIGILIGPLFGGTIYDLSGQRKEIPFLVACIFLLIDGVARLFIREPPRTTVDSSGSSGFLILLSNSFVCMLLGCITFGQGALASIEPVIPTYLNTIWELSSLYIGLIFAAVLIVFSICSPLVGYFIDKFPQWKMHVITIGLLLEVLIFPLLSLPSALWIEIFLLLWLGVSVAFSNTPTMPLLNAFTREKYEGRFIPSVVALSNCAYSIGGMIGPIFLSFTVETIGFTIGNLLVASVVLLFTVCFIYFAFFKKTLIEELSLDPN